MTLAAVLLVTCGVLVVLFAIARTLFGSACAVLLSGGVGYCFGGPPGAGIGIVLGLILVPVTYVIGIALLARDDSSQS